MPHFFDWNRKVGQDARQNPVYAAPVTLQGIHHDDVHSVTDAAGNKRTAMGTCYLADVYGVTTADELIFQGKSLGEIIRVEEWPNPLTGGPYGSVVHHG